MMTKTDFEAIAYTLNANRADYAMILDFADTLEERCPRFDRGLFVKAAAQSRMADLASEQRMLSREMTS